MINLCPCGSLASLTDSAFFLVCESNRPAMCSIYFRPSVASLLITTSLLKLVVCSYDAGQVINNVEEEGYYRREYSLIQPYHGTQSIIPIVCGMESLYVCFQVQVWIFPIGSLEVVQW